MGKSANFGITEQELIDKIVAYQKDNNISSFFEAVRKLCIYVLEVGKIKH